VLSLWGNSIGACNGPLANALQCNTTLTSLNLGNNQMGEMGGMALAQALATNTTLLTLTMT
jgi:Ran GTPase-activating protein (RanGAP) involved in mRNA processing and transport